MEGGAFLWGFDTPNGPIRYRIERTTDDEWHETGEIALDGETWRPFFEMTLQRAE